MISNEIIIKLIRVLYIKTVNFCVIQIKINHIYIYTYNVDL